MLSIEPTGAVLGASVHGLDLARPLADADFAMILRALGEHGVLRIPGQRIEAWTCATSRGASAASRAR